MATTVLHKRSSTASDIPSTTSLALGEIAVNTTDGYLFLKRDQGTEEVVTFRPSSLAYQDSVYITTDTGDGTTTDFTMGTAPKDDQYVFVTINGVVQHTDAYGYTTNTLSFNQAPALNDAIEIRVIETVATDVSLRDKQKYFYSITGTTSSLSGNDDNGLSLSYENGKVDVFQNGVKLIDGSDYTATTGTSITFTTSLESGDIVEIDSYAKAAILDHDAISPNSLTTSTTTANQALDIFSSLQYRTAKYIVSAESGSDYHATEVLLIHDGSTVYMTEYATIYTNASLITLNGDITNGNVRLTVTPTNANTTIRLQRITVAA